MFSVSIFLYIDVLKADFFFLIVEVQIGHEILINLPMENYNKIALDTPDLLAMLKQRGLQVPDEQEALRTLSLVSYFRIACCFRPMEIDKQTHEFRKGATLDQGASKISTNC